MTSAEHVRQALADLAASQEAARAWLAEAEAKMRPGREQLARLVQAAEDHRRLNVVLWATTLI